MSACGFIEKSTGAVIRSENVTIKARLARRLRGASVSVMLILAGCGGGTSNGTSNNPGGAPSTPPTSPPVTIGGTISGLATGTQLTVENNGADALTVNANGAFSFKTPVSFNSGYAVTVTTQPAKQICTVTNGTGTHATANVSNVGIVCGAAPAFAYVANLGDSTVSQYTEDANGSLIPLAPPTVPVLPSAVQVIVNPVGRFAYVLTGSGTIDQFTIGSDGALTALGTPVAVVGAVTGLGALMTIDPSGHFVYVAEPTPSIIAQLTIGGDGMLTPMSIPSVTAGVDVSSVTVHPGGRFAYSPNPGDGSISQFTIDATTGSLVAMTTPSVPSGEPSPTSAVIDPTGKYLLALDGPNSLLTEFSIGTDGALTSIPTSAVVGLNASVGAFDLSGRFFYVSNGTDGTISQFSFAADGTLVPLSPATVATGALPTQLVPDPTGRLLYVTNLAANTVSQYTIGQDGTLTPLGTPTVATGLTPLTIATSMK
jgi:6-phosphogluconolactonase